MGKVYLIGAGCGSYDLITLRGYELLKQADCVLYDRLIDPTLLRFVPPTCECINVGKQDHRHTLSQQAIQDLLIQKASQYACVIRLKGGDPYVFGRGGEEGLALYHAKIAFEVVPGISSSYATLSFAGFPITQRGINTGFRVYSAHTKEDLLTQIDDPSVSHTQDTLVFLMGMRHVQELCSLLLTQGKVSTTPVALICNGASVTQNVIITTLEEASQRSFPLQSPCTIVIGEVVSLRKQLNFYEQLPLFGKRIAYPTLSKELVTQSLRRAGANIEEVVCGVIKECDHAVHASLLETNRFLVFTSKHGIQFFMKQLLALGLDARALSHMKLICIGYKSAQALLDYHLQADIICKISDAIHVVETLREHKIFENILLVKAKNDDHTISDAFASGAVEVCECYETVPMPCSLEEKPYDAFIFTNTFVLHQCMREMKKWKQVEKIPVFSIGNTTTKALCAYGFKKIYQSERADRACLFDLVRKELGTCIEEED